MHFYLWEKKKNPLKKKNPFVVCQKIKIKILGCLSNRQPDNYVWIKETNNSYICYYRGSSAGVEKVKQQYKYWHQVSALWRLLSSGASQNYWVEITVWKQGEKKSSVSSQLIMRQVVIYFLGLASIVSF